MYLLTINKLSVSSPGFKGLKVGKSFTNAVFIMSRGQVTLKEQYEEHCIVNMLEFIHMSLARNFWRSCTRLLIF